MRNDRPSLTASLVAAVRAMYSALPEPWNLAPDPSQVSLAPFALTLPARAVSAARGTALGPAAFAVAHAGLGTIFLGVTHYVALRTRAIDDALREALGAGATELVLLGAGLDDRGGRLRELAGARVFEVDHPDMQRYKRERLARAGCGGDRTFVAVDFERDRLVDALPAAGFERAGTSFWIWEGVTVYLTPDAISATLAAVGALSAPGSRIAITYSEPGALDRLSPAIAMIAGVIGEPLRGALRRDEMRARLETSGFRVLSDEAPTTWASRYWPAERARVRDWERLVVAERI